MLVNNREINFYNNPQLNERLSKDFMKIVDTDVPFFTIKDELLFLMNERNIPCFRIPSTKTRDGLDHVFFFEVFVNDDLPKPKLYKYLYQKIDRSRKYESNTKV